MIVLEFKVKGKTTQYTAIDEPISTAQFVRNKAIRHWMDNSCVGQITTETVTMMVVIRVMIITMLMTIKKQQKIGN